MFRLFTFQAVALSAVLLVGPVHAQSPAVPGQALTPDALQQLERKPVVRIGNQAVRVLDNGAAGGANARLQRSDSGPASTRVVREGGSRVGVSHHELSVTEADPAQVAGVVASLAPQASVRTFPELRLTMIRTARFSELEPLARGISAALPKAKVDMPVQWSRQQPR